MEKAGKRRFEPVGVTGETKSLLYWTIGIVDNESIKQFGKKRPAATGVCPLFSRQSRVKSYSLILLAFHGIDIALYPDFVYNYDFTKVSSIFGWHGVLES